LQSLKKMARFNFPSRLPRDRSAVGISTFPSNLVTDNRSFYTEMYLSKYRPPSTTTIGGVASGIGSFFGNILGAAGEIIEDISNFETPTINTSGRTTDTSVMRLPIPKKVNENQVLSWNEVSVTDIITSLVAGTSRRRAGIIASVKGLGSAMTGAQVNPYLYLYFDRPTFKRFNFTWTLLNFDFFFLSLSISFIELLIYSHGSSNRR